MAKKQNNSRFDLGRVRGLFSRFFGLERQASIDFELPYMGNPIDFVDGDSITRDNFSSFFIATFAVSMGNPYIQLAYVQYLDNKYGSGALQSIQEFLSKDDPMKCLSEKEKEKWLEAYKKVRRHNEIDVRMNMGHQPSDFAVLDRIRGEFLMSGEFGVREVLLGAREPAQITSYGRPYIEWDRLNEMDPLDAKKYLATIVHTLRQATKYDPT